MVCKLLNFFRSCLSNEIIFFKYASLITLSDSADFSEAACAIAKGLKSNSESNVQVCESSYAGKFYADFVTQFQRWASALFFRAFALARPEENREWNAKKKKARKRKRRERTKKE
jgi:hypothetical protein